MAPNGSSSPMRRHPAVWWSRLKVKWPFLVWLVAAAAALYLYFLGAQGGVIPGTVEVDHEDAAPVETARLLTLQIHEGDRVAAGDIVATFDTTALDSELAVERLGIVRRFESDIASAEASLRDFRIKCDDDTARQAVLDEELHRMQDLFARHLIDEQSMTRVRIERDTLARVAAGHAKVLTELEREVARVRDQMSQMLAWLDGGAALTNVVASTEADGVRTRVSLLRARRDGYTIRAHRPGIVSRVNRAPGDVVSAGSAVANIVSETPRRFIGFVMEWRARDVKVGQKAFIMRPDGSPGVLDARVVSVGPDIMSLPSRVSPIPGQAVRGRRIVLEADESNDYVPGEAVTISFSRPNPWPFGDSAGRRDRDAKDGSKT